MNGPGREGSESGKTIDRTTANVEAGEDTGRDTHYHFPVSIEVVGGTSEEQIGDIEDRLWARLAQVLNHTG